MKLEEQHRRFPQGGFAVSVDRLYRERIEKLDSGDWDAHLNRLYDSLNGGLNVREHAHRGRNRFR